MKWLTILVLFFCAGCSENEQRSAEVLDEEKMASVLADVQLLEAAYTIEFARSDSSRQLMEQYYNQVFSRHDISRERFEESLNWYTVHNAEMIRIQERVAEILQEMNGNLSTSPQEKKK
jgi:hypothetical protein